MWISLNYCGPCMSTASLISSSCMLSGELRILHFVYKKIKKLCNIGGGSQEKARMQTRSLLDIFTAGIKKKFKILKLS